MILPGLISVAFYKRRPSTLQVALGLASTVLFSAILGYIFPPGPLGREGSVAVAVVGGAALYFAILAYLVYVYQPRRTRRMLDHRAPNAPETEVPP